MVLDRDVNTYLKRWKIPDNSYARDHSVTLRMLLTHQSGLNRPEGGFSSSGTPSIIQTLNGEFPATNDSAVIQFTPGTKWSYSNCGFIVIQLLIEEVVKKPFPQIAEEVVFSRTGIHDSTFDLPLPKSLSANEAAPHDAGGKAYIPSLDPNAVAHGGLMTTPYDLALFAIELMKEYCGESDKILSQNMAKKLFSNERQLDPSEMFGLSLSEGLGVIISGEGDNFSFLFPGSNAPGSECWIIGYPCTGKGIAIMANGEMGSLLAMEIIEAASKVYNWPVYD
jgi:CubicO group peptidase (beta-lactamase class C family)